MDAIKKGLDVISFKLAIVFILLAVLIAALVSLAMPKKYKATATLMVLEPLAERGLDRDYRKLEFAIETYSRVLKSSDLLLPVIAELQLDSPPTKFTVEKLKKVIKVKPVRDSQLIKVELEYSDPKLAAEIINRLSDEFLKFHKALMAGEAESSQKFYEEQLSSAEDKLKEADSRLTEFQKSAQIDELEKRLKVSLDKVEDFRKSLSYNQIECEKTTKMIEAAKAKLHSLSREQVSLRSHLLTSDTNKASLKGKLEELSSKLTKIDTKEEEVKAAVEKLKYEVTSLKEKIEASQTVNSEDLANLDALIDRLPPALLGDTSSDFIGAASDAQKIIVELNPIYREVERNLVNSEIYLAQLEGERKALEQALTKAKKEYEELNDKLSELYQQNKQLLRDQEIYSQTYKDLSSKIDQLRIDVAAKIGDVVLVERAHAPSKPVSPNLLKNVLAAAALSALFMASLLYLKFSYPKKRDESKNS